MSSNQAERRKQILARNEEQLGVLNQNWPIRWVMMRTSHPGNVGSAARAIKTMGFSALHLVNPAYEYMARKAEAISLSSGAFDVLEAAQNHESMLDALGDSQLVFGLTARDREFGPPAISLPEAVSMASSALVANKPVSFVFGTERTGLDNEDLKHCTHRVWIDANPSYPSLNLAQAMMIVAYSMRQGLMKELAIDSIPPENLASNSTPELADPSAIAAMLEHWQQGLEAIGYLDPENPKKLMPRLQSLFARAALQKEEIDLLRGIAKQMLQSGKIK
ncbi:RNA methyltransferase [Polynucleobacter sp. MWH-CaK5]|uniref:RNA methyltransferase n=1 Tax=Polynucleobacter sp. MWH-CaK5 TaxID=2689107 RepID=UPI001BFE0C10|nr:TrmH family RNA methyltransferase [Polynucleobacter sp. MWH-CaK5]QWD88404.1 RNA methyltransferase [Polynucleobacter sp. MWH-CaK5]